MKIDPDGVNFFNALAGSSANQGSLEQIVLPDLIEKESNIGKSDEKKTEIAQEVLEESSAGNFLCLNKDFSLNKTYIGNFKFISKCFIFCI